MTDGRVTIRDTIKIMLMIKTFLALLLVGGVSAPSDSPRPSSTRANAPTDKITVYRARTCGCCGKWIQHLRDAGFKVVDHVVENVENAPGRDRVPENLRSCHTASVGRYVVEGHVPADVVQDLLRRRPDVEGIAVPGMPAGSPGMESPNPEPYEVVAWTKGARTRTFARR